MGQPGIVAWDPRLCTDTGCFSGRAMFLLNGKAHWKISHFGWHAVAWRAVLPFVQWKLEDFGESGMLSNKLPANSS